MKTTYVVHILAGTLGLVTGYVALFVVKGGAIHKRAGMLFVYSMLAMCAGGLAIAVSRGIAAEINVPAALITAYLIITALTTVRPLPPGSRADRAIALSGMGVAASVAAVMLSFAFEAVTRGGRNGLPAFPFVMFATFALLGLWGDVRVMRHGPRKGGARLARHLWRMSMALFIAALSFSFQAVKLLKQQGFAVPSPLPAAPMLLVLALMFYWLWRVRARRPLRGVITIAAAEPA
jgi:hypothetical protein